MKVIKKLLAWVKRWLLDNFWLKIFSLIMAVALWSFVLTNDTTITRERTLTNLYVTTSNQSTLDNRGLAITESLSEILPQVRVSVEVTQNDYYRVTTNNVRVELDLSRIRETGEQTVPITASTVYGTVSSIYPDSITVDVDELEERNVQVEIGMDGTDDTSYWYSSATSNPSIITVTGPASQVEQVASVRATMDLSGVDTIGTVTRAVAFKLLDSNGGEVDYPTLSTSTSSVITSVEVYPIEEIPVESDTAKIITGSVAAGYQIDSVEIQPSTISVAASRRFLDSLKAVSLYSINVNDMSETTTKTTRVNRQSEMKYLSTEEVLVTVHISEKEITRSFDSLTPRKINVADAASVDLHTCTLTITGPYTKVAAITRGDIDLYVDAYGLTESGEYDLPVQYSLDGDISDLTISVAPQTVKVKIQ